ncbi:class I SAM-dependent methyltransferase [Paenibacillus sp. Z6-24]
MPTRYYNDEEYDHPHLYDEENEGFQKDVYFLSSLAESTKGPVIDLACGTGRATIPLAAAGHRMIGVDLHPGMLDAARSKSASLPAPKNPIQWIQQNIASLQLDQQSDFIFTVGNSFQHFLTNEEQDGLLRSVYQHLISGGRFVFNTRFPSTAELLQPEREEYWRTYTDSAAGHQVEVSTISHYDTLTQIQHYRTIRRYKDNTREIVNELSTQIYLRYTYPQELERLLNQHGFEVLHRYEDWRKTPLSATSKHMVYVCQKR